MTHYPTTIVVSGRRTLFRTWAEAHADRQRREADAISQKMSDAQLRVKAQGKRKRRETRA